MIITAGKYKGKRIDTIKGLNVRPTSSKIRESIFNIIQLSENSTIFFKEEIKILDLFAGSGIMGFEALSRGASKLVCVEKSPRAAKLLRKNINNINPEIKLINKDALIALDMLKDEKFNFIFIDPPYFEGLYEKVLEKIKKLQLLTQNGFIVIEYSSKTPINEIIGSTGFNIFKSKKYGDTGISILTLQQEN